MRTMLGSPVQHSTQLPCRRAPVSLRPLPLRHTSRRTTSWVVDTASTAQADTLTAVEQAKHAEPQGPASSPSAAAAQQLGTFPWTQHWYPVAVVDDLDPARPHATHLLGIPLALWRDKQGAWHAVEDKCPHRLAPLSEGRIESDGTLQCSYHGWQFDGRGACTHIPQLCSDDKAHQVACASRRSCVRAFPTQIVHGLLWARPDGSAQAHEEFARDPSPPKTAIKELLSGPEAEGYLQTTQWYARDVPMRFDTLCENILDPSHVPFAHHKVQGNRNNEKGTTTKVQGEVTADGFKFELDSLNPRFGVSTPVFEAPNFIRYGNPIRSLNVFAVPTRPGWSRIYVTFMKDTRLPSRLPWLVETIYGLVEKTTWLEHIFQRHPVLDGDNYILHTQERFLHEANGDWRRGYYMPAPADESVVAVREWFDKFGGVVPTCEPGTPLPPRLTKREALDRYSQHTAHCRHCQKALRNVDVATGVAAAAGLLAAAWLLARAMLGLPLLAPATGLGLLAAAAAGAAVAGLRALRQQFIFVDYVHADKH
ncbi:hypothetical protein PLESTF_000801600 [Pleodorina starrii]|nr:hypothetical protein PLESTM_001160400 [Pleodorina starrii]GLC69203.1 hypothetical protein PLESTF_000801600 [Pleodorina starrii]